MINDNNCPQELSDDKVELINLIDDSIHSLMKRVAVLEANLILLAMRDADKQTPTKPLVSHEDMVEKFTPKKIDWSKVAKGVPCEFSDNKHRWFRHLFGGLGLTDRKHPFHRQQTLIGCDELGEHYRHCRFALNVPTLWQGGECPLPEGVIVKITQRNSHTWIGEAYAFDWGWVGVNIISYEITGLANEWGY